ncbi:uncharacterized protein K452DRAFT_122710 [Aplosporella prunicola CBS 121167]|uniref:Uncharacterized protein n=1 Tax=Aplosporella prunicola CBS 121167 TaxID=1176127 RepID=A0A6A6BQB0_9PEZI|nr:uncharacterized protein K452DRAFT_122710 [Aplosporella prunicola CBS 121167]KAF2145613.1 hypothetical protein K452DRAFT_122710 [Aplosporella prunicola CBS 121167]
MCMSGCMMRVGVLARLCWTYKDLSKTRVKQLAYDHLSTSNSSRGNRVSLSIAILFPMFLLLPFLGATTQDYPLVIALIFPFFILLRADTSSSRGWHSTSVCRIRHE